MFVSKGHGRDFWHGPLCWRTPLPSYSARHQSVWDWWPFAALCSCTFLLCHTQRQIFLAEALLCAESSYSLMCFKFVSIFYGGLQPLMQMCNGSCKSARQGENTSGAWFSFMLVLAALCCTGSVKGPQSGCQGCVKSLSVFLIKPQYEQEFSLLAYQGKKPRKQSRRLSWWWF